MKSEEVVGEALATVLPRREKSWLFTPHLLKLNLLLLVPLLSSAVAGYDGSVMNGFQSLPAWQSYFNHPKGAKLGFLNASQSVGSVLALPVIGWMSDRLGRRISLGVGALIIVIASILQAAAVNYGMFVFARVLVGIGSIMVVQPSPLLLAEVSYPTHRGVYTALFWTMFYLGAIIAAWSTYGTNKNLPGSMWGWRAPSIIQGVFPLLQLIFLFWVPESPRWLLANGKAAQAREILGRYHAAGDEKHPLVDFEVAEIETAIRIDGTASKTSWMALVKTPGNRKRTLITLLLGFFSQWTGSTVVSYYLSLVLNTVGITDPDTQTLINGLLQLFNFGAAIMAAFLVDRLGRRTLWNWSGCGMLVSFIVWTACSAEFDRTGKNELGIAVIVFIFVFYFHYDIAYTPLVFAYPAEINSYQTRSKAISAELGVVYCSLIMLSFVNPIALENIGWRYYVLFCVILAISVVVNWFLLPETKGRSLEELHELFDKDLPAHANANTVLENVMAKDEDTVQRAECV